MIYAYDKIYLEKARTSLARAVDFAVYDLNYGITVFFELFITSGTASLFESGDVNLIAGKSGVELAYEVLERSGIERPQIVPDYPAERSEEYWMGWALAYYQWETGLSFENIINSVSAEDICALYHPYHEMDIRQFVDKMNELYRLQNSITNLKTLRLKAGLSQSQLAEQSGVPVRTIQQYEQRQKNINKAQAAYLVSLSDVLCCEVRELMEPYGEER